MQLILIRKIKTDNSTIGELSIDSIFFSYTLELPWRNNHINESCIPVGTYEIHFVVSDHFKKMLPILEDVPGRSEILIHVGNYPHDTHGCILVGYSKDIDFVGNSGAALNNLVDQISQATKRDETVTIKIMEA